MLHGATLIYVLLVKKCLQERKQRAAEGKEVQSVVGQNSGGASDTKEGQEERVIILRPLNMEDFRLAKSQVK